MNEKGSIYTLIYNFTFINFYLKCWITYKYTYVYFIYVPKILYLAKPILGFPLDKNEVIKFCCVPNSGYQRFGKAWEGDGIWT